MDYFTGVVFLCPNTNKQVALHKNNLILMYMNAGVLGHEVDIRISDCPVCRTNHALTVPLD